MNGNLPASGDVVSKPRPSRGQPGSQQIGGARARLARSPFGAARLRAYWLTPPGIVMLIATVLAVAIRLFTLTRAGYLRGITEYDDGVYIGGALRLVEGQLPYKDFAFIQPPGILLLMRPVALIAKITTTVKGLALARVLTGTMRCCPPLPITVRKGASRGTAASGSDTSSLARRPEP